MTALAAIRRMADPREVLIARAEARACLYRAYDLELHEAVDVLQAAAVQSGLVAAIGQDQVQAIMAEAFAAAPEPAIDMSFPDAEPEQDEVSERGPVPKSTIDAAKYLVREGDCDRLRKWLNGRSAPERAAILAEVT